MISCKDFVAQLGSYLEDDLAAELWLALDQHLASCTTCQVIVDSSRKTLTIVTDSGEFQLSEILPESVTARIMARIRAMPLSTPDS
jgi:anti-sigma factor RsiW